MNAFLPNPADIGAGVLNAFQQGRSMRAEQETRNALAGLVANPNDAKAMSTLASFNPQAAFAMQDRQAQQQELAMQRQATQQKQQQTDMGTFRQLLAKAEESPEGWQQAMGAAQSMGLDVSSVPQQFDPVWARQQRFIIEAMEKDQDKLPGIAEELRAAGYEPGTPEFVEAIRGVIQNKYAAEYVDENGNTRRRSALNLAGTVGGPQPGVVEDGYRFKGGNPADPSAWELVGQGGQTGAPSATFSAGFRGLDGERVTSTRRTPAKNRSVGGVANSYHLTGQARDSVPPRGMSMSAYAAQLKRMNPDMDVINEGDHVHMEPKG